MAGFHIFRQTQDMQVGKMFSGAGTSYVHTFTSLGGQVLVSVFAFRSVRFGLGFGYCLAGGLANALIVPAAEDSSIENRDNPNRKTCSIRCEGIVFYVLRSEKRPAVSLPWGDCVGMGIDSWTDRYCSDPVI